MTIVIVSAEIIGERMAGPAIRCLELARVLARHFQVELAAPEGSSAPEGAPALSPFSYEHPQVLIEQCQSADVVISNGYLVGDLPFLAEMPVPWVADLYIPAPIESLAWYADAGRERQEREYMHAWRTTRTLAGTADFFLCASERQRDFWLGVLAAHGRLAPALYGSDPSLGRLIDVVPFGCPAEPPVAMPVLKGVLPGIAKTCKMILWGGGVWNWFDPLTLLRAMPAVIERYPEARLIFMGADHPDTDRVPGMAVAREARELGRRLGIERYVHWLDWVPYADRGAYWLEADVGVSLNRPGAENRLAFRTRLLDAIWTGLPMVLTGGDVLSEEMESRRLATIVHAQSPPDVAEAIIAWLQAGDRDWLVEALGDLRQRYAWDRVARPLVAYCNRPWVDPCAKTLMDRPAGGRDAEMGYLQSELERLSKLVEGYESGRIMRLLRWLRLGQRRGRHDTRQESE